MNNLNNVVNKGFSTKIKNTYDIGLKGQYFVEQACLRRGYKIYKKNFKKIGLEIDLIMYKYIESKNLIIVRIIEVKTRSAVFLHTGFDMESLDIEGKWVRVKKYMFLIVDEIKNTLGMQQCSHVVHFDLALVAHNSRLLDEEGAYTMYTYMQDVDLLI